MIKFDNYTLDVKGTPVSLYADMSSIFTGVNDNVLKSGYPKKCAERSIKGFMFIVEKYCKEHDIDCTITADERKLFTDAYARSEKMANRVSKGLKGIADLLSAFADDCEDSKPEKEDADKDSDDDGHVIVKALPADSDTAKKILELLGIEPDKDDDTEDDIPDFLF